MIETRYYFCALIDHPLEPGKRITPTASIFALDARTKLGEDVSGWLGIPDGMIMSLVKLDADVCIIQITAEIKDLDKMETSQIFKRIELSKDVASQTKSTVDLVKYGASLTDTAAVAIKKVCKGVDSNLETFFDDQKDPTVKTKVSDQEVIR